MKVIDKGSAKPGDPIYNGGFQVIDLLPILMDALADALATNTPLAETGWAPMEFSPRGCCTK